MFTGEKLEGGIPVYYKNGKKFTGTRRISGIYYYYKNGVKFTGYRIVEGINYYYRNGKKYNGDHMIKGVRHLYVNGKARYKYVNLKGTTVLAPIKGTKLINVKGGLFISENGMIATNKEISVNGKKYKANSNGVLTEVLKRTYTTFVDSRKGKATDYDGRHKAQCVDEIKDYLHYLWDINPGAWGNAHAYYDDFEKHKELTDNFSKIANTPDFVPQKGDIMVWNKSFGGTGHIAICTGEGNVRHFYSWDQNWTGNNDPMTRIKHDYSRVLGVLRPKNQALMV